MTPVITTAHPLGVRGLTRVPHTLLYAREEQERVLARAGLHASDGSDAAQVCAASVACGRREYSPTMSQEEIDRMRRGYAAFNEGDLGPLLRLLDPDVEWRGILGEAYNGAEAVREFFEQLPWNPPARLEPEEFIETGDWYLVSVRVSLRGQASGIEAGGHICQAILFKDGKIVEYREYGSKEEASEVLGLRA